MEKLGHEFQSGTATQNKMASGIARGQQMIFCQPIT
jgi:hypothetical protein